MTKDELHSLKRNLYHWAKENLRGTSVTNKQTGNIAAKFTHSEKKTYIRNEKMHLPLSITNVRLKLKKMDSTQ